MAQGYGTDVTFVAGADLSTKQFTFVKLDTSADNQVVACSAAGEDAIGVLQNKPASGQAATVRIFGKSKIKLGGNVTRGDKLKTDSAGKAVTATAASTNTSDAGAAADALVGSFVLGKATVSGSTSDVAEIMLFAMGAVPTTAA